MAKRSRKLHGDSLLTDRETWLAVMRQAAEADPEEYRSMIDDALKLIELHGRSEKPN